MARRGEGGDDRPKRSWREIDKMRDKSFSRGRSQEDRQQERLERSPVYEQYKAAVSRMFSGGEMPEALREKLDSTGEMKVRDELLKRIKKTSTEDRKAWAEAVTEFVGKFELPADAYLLLEWLDHPKDPVLEKALDKLAVMGSEGLLTGPKAPKSIDQKLRALELKNDEPDIVSRVKALREKLR